MRDIKQEPVESNVSAIVLPAEDPRAVAIVQPQQRVPMEERPEIAWRMRQMNPPASWAAIARACGVRVGSGYAQRWFLDACDKRGLPRSFWIWECFGSRPYRSVDDYRQGLIADGRCSPAEIEEYTEEFRVWFEWDQARRRGSASVCPVCNGTGLVRPTV